MSEGQPSEDGPFAKRCLTGRDYIIASAIVAVCAAFSLIVIDGAFPTSKADSTADWLVASAFAQGLDPYADLHTLSDHYDVPFWEGSDVVDRVVKHPRTPGALLVLSPLALVTPDQARVIMIALGWLAVVGTVVALAKAVPMSTATLLGVVTAAMLSGPARWNLIFVTQSSIVMFLVALVLVTAVRGDYFVTGLALAIAVSLKVFPIVLFAVLLMRSRKRAIAAGLAAVAILNSVPLLLPNVSLQAMFSAMTDTSGSWVDLTIGLPGLLARSSPPGTILVLAPGIALVALALIPAMRRRIPPNIAAMGLLAASLLALPLSWPHYLLAMIPPVALGVTERRFRGASKLFLVAGCVLLIPLQPIILHTLGLILILTSVLVEAFIGNLSDSRAPIPATMV